MITLSPDEAGEALGTGPLSSPVDGISVDSRSIRPGELFIALRGERFDGHDFVAAAIEAGASGVVVEKGRWSGGSAKADGDFTAIGSTAVRTPVYEVADALEALGALARAVRRKSGAMVFAITGSVGKTSTKDLIEAMVGRVRNTVATTANQNNEIGVPLTLLAMVPSTEAAVVEMGMRGRNQIASLARVAEPDIGVITNIHPVHLELLGTVENIAEAKAELVRGLGKDGTVVVPYECKVLQPYLKDCKCRVVYFGTGRGLCVADVESRLERSKTGPGWMIALRWPEGEALVEVSYMPAYRLENVAAATAACYAAGLPVAQCVQGIKEVRFSAGRGEVMRLPGICLIDDTYNANPAAVRAALDNLVRLADEEGGRAVAVLGDMLELGPESERYHWETGRYAADIGVRGLWGVGSLARGIAEGFRGTWVARKDAGGDWVAGHVDSAGEASSVVEGLRAGDVILFKASRAVKLESMVSVVAALAEAGAWTGNAGVVADETGRQEEVGPCSN